MKLKLNKKNHDITPPPGRHDQVVETQSTAWMTAHGGVAGGRRHDVTVANDIRAMTTNEGVDGSQGAGEEPMVQSNTAGTGDQGRVAVTSV